MSRVSITKEKLDYLANCISDKSGDTIPLTIDDMADAVLNIQTGVGTLITKNIAENGTYTARDDSADGYSSVTVNVPTPTPTLQTVTKTYTPTESQQTETITPGSGYDGIEEVDVTVNAISSTYVGSGITQRDSSDLSASGATVTAPAGYYASAASKSVASGTEGTPTATKGTVSNHAVNVTPSVTNTAGYISGGTKTGTAVSVSASELVSGTYNVTSSGTKDVTNYASASVPSGSATPAASISGTAATVSTGTNTLTLSKTVSNTPQVSAGYVSSGTAGNSSVSLTANVTTKAAATITPGTTNQTITSGTYLTGTQTISGDANLIAGNIKNGTSIFGVTGTYEGSNPVKTATGTFTGNGTRTIDVACDFEPDLVYVTSDPGTTASSGTVAFIIARDMMAASRYRNNSTTNSHYAVTPCVNLNTSGSSYSWRATYANSKVTLYSYSNNARALLTNGRTYTYKFVKWTT